MEGRTDQGKMGGGRMDGRIDALVYQGRMDERWVVDGMDG